MRTFSLNEGRDPLYSTLVWNTIIENVGYFKKFNMDRWQEAMHMTYITAIQNRDKSYGYDIEPYIKKLARTILRSRGREDSYSVVNDEGEVSWVFSVLRDEIDISRISGKEVLKDRFKELYLMDRENFLKLRDIFVYDDIDSLDLRSLRTKSPKIYNEIKSLIYDYGVEVTFGVLQEFFEELPMLCPEKEPGGIREILLKEGNYAVLSKIPDTPTIVDDNGNYHFLDRDTLTMDINPDYINWRLIGNSKSRVFRIDILPFVTYLYEQVYVQQGVNTRHIIWCGEKYSVKTPGGVSYICLDREKFISICRVELVINLLQNNIGNLVAASPDNLYFKPSRRFNEDVIRLRFKDGKVIDLEVSLYK